MNKLLLKLFSAWDKQVSYVFCSSLFLFIFQLIFVEINSKNIADSHLPIEKNKKSVLNISTKNNTQKIRLDFELTKPSVVEVELVDKNGKTAETNEESYLPKGKNSIDISHPVKGKYLLLLKIDHEVAYNKTILNE